MSAGDKRILYRNHCVPQEQVDSDGRYYLDGDCGRKLTGSNLYELGSNTTATGTVTLSGAIGTTLDFIAVIATSISSGTVMISLDNGTTSIIELKEGECFASKIASGSQPYVTISGTASVDYMSGT